MIEYKNKKNKHIERPVVFLSDKNLATLVFSLTALIFYTPAMFFPIMKIELYGNVNSATVYSGVVSLFNSGNWFIASVVLLASIILPLAKILTLLFLTSPFEISNHAKKKLLSYLEFLGPWAMLDVFLVAILISIVKLGSWATIEVQAGTFYFLLVVLASTVAARLYSEESSEDTPDKNLIISRKDNKKKYPQLAVLKAANTVIVNEYKVSNEH